MQPHLDFLEWTELLTRFLRVYIPRVRIARGHDKVRWAYGHKVVHCVNDSGTFWIRYDPTSLDDVQRPDDLTARNFATVIAAHLDSERSVAD